MARPRFLRSRPKLQQAILTAAAKEFATIGYAGASVNRILEEAGLSKGAFYYYFDDKADLAATVLESSLKSYLAGLRHVELPGPRANFWEEADLLLRRSLAGLKRSGHTELVAHLASGMVHDSQLASRVAPLMSEAYEAVARLWGWGQRHGAVRKDLPLEHLVAILASIKLAMVRVLLPENGAPTFGQLEKFAALQMDIFRRVAEARPPVRRRARRRQR